ncbi:Gamma-soluble NSF attachment protein [Microtus ochrogaster]|uniref:Gamma-soluble NSF attachment protein n=1 Tax=Microtus ochrogaster TaxID=79684 RepID=A0A8J6GKY5_MICOH|nr:Gamma-soluble NSF attachment protein [Microtus ochrogaster]
MQKLPEAVQLIEKASMMYLENGTPDTAAMALERAGKLIENVDPEKAVQLYQQTANVFENEERLRQAVELLGKASRLLVRGRSIPGFNGSEDCAALEQLLEGYDQQDQDQVSDVCNSPLFKYMDNDYAKLGLSLVVPGGGIKKKSPATPQAKPDGAASTAAEEEEDEYSGGLC